MHSKSCISLIVPVIVALMLMFGCAPAAAPEEEVQTPQPTEEVIELTIDSRMPVGFYSTDAIDVLCQEAEKRSNGRLKMTHYPAQQLYKDSDLPDVIPKGLQDMGQANLPMWCVKVPIADTFMPGWIKDFDHFYRFSYDVSGTGGFIDKVANPVFEKTVNTKILATTPLTPNFGFVFNEPVKTLEDFEGKKIRVFSRSGGIALEAIGASPVVMSSAEYYMAMQRGTIDAIYTDLPTILGRKLWEVSNFVANIYTAPGCYHIVINLDSWNSLSPDLQDALFDAAKVAEIWAGEQMWQFMGMVKDTAVNNGMEWYDFPEEESERCWALMRPAMLEDLQGRVGKDMADRLVKAVEATRDGKMSWKEACESHTLMR